ncbi:hypothetical protein R4227_06015 [Gordonia amicalis]|uniref:hypothetical protein n=1 Tax=Gordonia amicalis TaxID=89053 RepID=UPI0029529FAE|nr:hypothetical protein [Gordonia amicalis]MDV7099697.1 hypothetical protein [Gordonia amicalis]
MRWKLHVPDAGDVLADDRATVTRLQEILDRAHVDAYIYTRTGNHAPWRMVS